MRLPHVSMVALAMLGCSSIPDVQFLDVDAGGTTSSGGVPDAGPDTVPDAALDAGPDADPRSRYRCPDDPPPDGRGICCGTSVCLRCTQAHCDKCGRAACGDGQACCPKNAGQSMNVECRSQWSCD